MENPIDNDPNARDCREFLERLGEQVGAGLDVKSHPHLQTCEICRALVSEIDIAATEAIVAKVVRRRFRDDEGPESGAPAVLPKGPKPRPGSATAAQDSDAE